MSKVCQPTQSQPDPVEQLLARIVSRTLRSSLLGGALLASCSDADVGLGANAPPGSIDPCARGLGLPVQASGLKLREPHDYVAVRERRDLGAMAPPGDWSTTAFDVLDETGTACATATTANCSETVRGHPSAFVPSYCVQTCSEWSVVTTRGDAVERAATPAELVALLGAIDSPDEALMLAAANGYDVRCRDASSADALTGPAERWLLAVRGGFVLIAMDYAEICPVTVRHFRLFVGEDGVVRELEHKDLRPSHSCIGRTPAGLAPRVARRNRNTLGEHLAACAHLEAASVHAFVRLADELCSHGAPQELVERALLAAQDETRHARVVSALARYHDGVLTTPELRPVVLRPLEEIARENAVEGCVRETYGALVGAHQAASAADPYLRDALIGIAVDEARHAALSHDVDAWLMSRLDDGARARVRRAQRQAIDQLYAESAREPEPSLRRAAGLPSAAVAQQLLRELARELWIALA